MQSDDIAIKIDNISKSFKIPHENVNTLKSKFLQPFKKVGHTRFDALKDVSFEVKKGEFLGIIGRNGSGKSTLLKLIAGIYEPDKGKIQVNGKIVPFLELGVGFNPELTARENVFLNGTILGMTRKYLKEKYDEIMDFAEVREFEDMPLKNFSSGMYVRLAFSIAIQADADIYLLDEVLAVGDQMFQHKSLKRLMGLKRDNKTILFVSHALNDIEQHCSKVVYIDNHTVKTIGKPADSINLYNQDNIQISQDTIETSKEEEPAEQQEKKSEEENKNLSRDPQIKNLEILDAQEKPINTIVSGGKVTFRIHYLTKKACTSPKFGIAIYKDFDKVVYGTNNEKRGKKISNLSKKSKGHIDFVFERLTLLAGNYQISIAIATEDGLQDQQDRKYDFTINNGELRDYGICNLAPNVYISF